MGKIVESPMTDEELKAKGIEIPVTETDGTFYAWIDGIIDRVFKENNSQS